MTKYADRPRDPEFMARVHLLPCTLRGIGGAGRCNGRIQADHAGVRVFGHRADDRSCIPMCTRHHRDRTDYTGYFYGFGAAAMREWCDQAIDLTQERVDWLGVVPWF